MGNTNKNFNRAKKLKNDEWKTNIESIELELGHPKDMKRKYSMWLDNVLCCCNDIDGAFRDYFTEMALFHASTIERYQPIWQVVFTEYKESGQARMVKIDRDGKKTESLLKGNGDFESNEIKELIKEATFIITNPPFSKFRKFVELLTKYKWHQKKFLIIGPKNACAYKWYFELWKEGKINYGNTFNDNFWFQNKEGEWKIFRNIAWHTNLIAQKWPFVVGPKYKKENYFMLENYPAIFVDKVKNIPVDYDGLMAVPPSFGYRLDKNQFELVDRIEPIIDGKKKYTKIIIKKIKNVL